jgi:hypothetical protein
VKDLKYYTCAMVKGYNRDYRCQLVGSFRNCKNWAPIRHSSAVARLLGLRVRIPPEAWMSLCCECCMLLGRGLCDGPISQPEESYHVCVCVCVCVMIVIRCSYNPLHLQWGGGRGQIEKEKNKERKSYNNNNHHHHKHSTWEIALLGPWVITTK